MRTYQVTSAADFNGAGAGALDFGSADMFGSLLSTNKAQVPIITICALEPPSIAAYEFDCFLLAPGELVTSTRRITIATTVSTTAAPGFTKAGCRIAVPRDTSTVANTCWTLHLVTTGIPSAVTWTVAAEFGRGVIA